MLTETLSNAWVDQQLTHMPFLCRQRLRYLLVFGRSTLRGRRAPKYSPQGTKRIWRLASVVCNPKVGTWGDVESIKTGLRGNELECSPCVSELLGRTHLSFIGTANHGTGQLQHHLYRMSGPSITELGPAVRVTEEECMMGFWRPDLTAMASGTNGVIHFRGAINGRLETGFRALARVSFDSELPHRLLITGAFESDSRRFRGRPFLHTIVYDLNERQVLGELLMSGSTVYKPSLCGNLMATVLPGPETAPESMKIMFSKDFELVPTTFPARMI